MLCTVKRPDDVTTAESNPVGFRFTVPNQFASICPSNQFESILPSIAAASNFCLGAIAQEVLGRKSLNMVLPSRGLQGQSPQSLKQFADVYRFDSRNDQNPKISHNPSSDS